jgi:PAS domain-containing protein
MQGTLQDVTERKATQTALYLTEMRYREAQRIAKIGNWEWDLATNTSWWSEELYRILEEDPQRYPATFDNFIAKIHPDDRQVLIEGQWAGPLAARPRVGGGRVSRMDAKGHRATRRNTCRRVRSARGGRRYGPRHHGARALEDRLRESEVRYASTVEPPRGHSACVGEEGRFVWSNQRLRDMLGYSSEEFGLTVWNLASGRCARHGHRPQTTSRGRDRYADGENAICVTTAPPGFASRAVRRGADGADDTFVKCTRLKLLAKACDTTIARVALAWVQGRPGVSSTIIGARTMQQLDDTSASARSSSSISIASRSSTTPWGTQPVISC